MHEEDDDDVGALERLIALQRLRVEQVRIHLGSLVPTQFAASQARAALSQMLEDLRKLESAGQLAPRARSSSARSLGRELIKMAAILPRHLNGCQNWRAPSLGARNAMVLGQRLPPHSRRYRRQLPSPVSPRMSLF